MPKLTKPCKLFPRVRSDGYGRTAVNGKQVRAHIIALEEKLGRPLRTGYLALHHCDVRNCVEPEHLYEGTYADNQNDAHERTYKRNPKRAWYPKRLNAIK